MINNNSKNQVKYSFTAEHLSFFESKIKECEKHISQNNLDLNYYTNVSNNLFKYVNEHIPKNQKKHFKNQLRFFLLEKFFASRIEIRKKLLSQIHSNFFSFLNTINSKESIQELSQLKTITYSHIEQGNNNYKEIYNELKRVQNACWERCVRYILQNIENAYNLKVFPDFLLYNERKLFRYKIQNILSSEMNIPFDKVKLYNKYMFQYLINIWDGLNKGNNNINLFEDDILSSELKEKLLKLLYISNKHYCTYENNKTVFSKKLLECINIMKLSEHRDKIIQEYNEYCNNNGNETDINLVEELGKELEFIDYDTENEKCRKFYYIIFCFSSLLNNIVTYQENSENNTFNLSFASNLVCSAKDRQFLYNLLNYIDNNISKQPIALKINDIIEKYIFTSFLQKHTSVLFNENNTQKIPLSFNYIYKLIQSPVLNKEQSELIQTEFNLILSNYIQLSKNEIESLLYLEETTPSQAEEVAKKALNIFKNSFNSISHTIISQDNINDYSIQNLQIVPQDFYKISTHICLCIYGLIQPEHIDNLSKNILINLIGKQRNVDFFFYNWQNKDNFYKTNVTKNIVGFLSNFISKNKVNYEQVNKENIEKMKKNNKKISKFYGKLLAYIIISRSIFKYHSISLLGVSIGCNVIKYCLKELLRLQQKGISSENILNNVIFIGGACTLNENDKHKELFYNVNGKVVNCFSKGDSVVKDNYSENAIGIRELEIKREDNKIYIPQIVNIDFSNLQLKQEDYNCEIPMIMNQIRNL